MSYEISGTLLEIFEEQQVSPRFKKREFVIEKDNNGFVDQIKFQLVQDKTNLIDGFKTGDLISVTFDIKGNKWKDNYFVNLQAWKLVNNSTSGAQQPPVDNITEPPPAEDIPFPDDAPEDDLPF